MVSQTLFSKGDLTVKFEPTLHNCRMRMAHNITTCCYSLPNPELYSIDLMKKNNLFEIYALCGDNVKLQNV